MALASNFKWGVVSGYPAGGLFIKVQQNAEFSDEQVMIILKNRLTD
jgi:hypothetical protein